MSAPGSAGRAAYGNEEFWPSHQGWGHHVPTPSPVAKGRNLCGDTHTQTMALKSL